jgi:hypothetical protein
MDLQAMVPPHEPPQWTLPSMFTVFDAVLAAAKGGDAGELASASYP